ncbi:MAG: hypothetical protein F4X37_10820 [Acidimicrobiia bacterium]|nr:hypothetical protein [Acidimicrobiia bacterium]
MARLRARGPARLVVAAFVCAALAPACTISSESPEAAGLRGPASGTTTTAGTGSEAGDVAPASGGDEEPDREIPADASRDSAPAVPAASPDGPAEAEAPDEAASAQPDSIEPAPPPAQPAEEEAAEAGPAASSDDEAVEEAHPAASAGGQAEAEPPAPATPASDGAAFGARSAVSTVGVGAVYFGMSPEEAAERVGTAWAGTPAGRADCYVITPANGPPGVALWVVHGTVERVDIDTPLLRTPSGLGVGSHLGELRSSLGDKLLVEEHPYLAGWILATFVPTDPNDAAFRIAFDVSGGEVIRYRAGRTEIVELEGCA